MIQTMFYLFLVASLFGLAGHFAEKILGELALPRRFCWGIALTASIALPGFALIALSESPSSAIISLPLSFEFLPDFNATATATATDSLLTEPWLTWPDWAVFDAALATVWILSSAGFGVMLLTTSINLVSRARRSERKTIENKPVLVSDRIGPAVFGCFRPRIILPRWLAAEESELRTLVLHHEHAHLLARDHLFLLTALTLVATMPWNLALWWQLKRLRAAIEIDCDARVLNRGINAKSYAEALLAIGQRNTYSPLGTVALTEPVSDLERRIKTMLKKTRRFSLAVIGSRTALAIAAIAFALFVNAPKAQQSTSNDATDFRVGAKPVPAIRTAVFEQLNLAQECIEAGDTNCASGILDTVTAIPDLSNYELAQLENFRAFVSFEADDLGAATTAYETILALPSTDLPNGLIQSTTRSLATLYLQQDRFQDGLAKFDEWMALPFVTPDADDHYLKATILYQLEEYDQALDSMETAIRQFGDVKEQHYQLLYVLQYQTDDWDSAIETLEIMNENWPESNWAIPLQRLRNGQAFGSATEENEQA